MTRDQLIGWLLVAVSAIVVVVYTWLLFAPPDWKVMGMPVDQFLLKLTAWLAVALVFGLLGWVGYTLATTPPPKPIEEIEKEIEEELKKLEQELKAQEEKERKAGEEAGKGEGEAKK